MTKQLFECAGLAAVAEQIRGVHRVWTLRELNELLEIVECCRRLEKFDLADAILSVIESSESRNQSVEQAVKAQRHLVSRKESVDSQSAHVPPLIIRGLNFGIAMWKWACSGFECRTREEVQERLEICQSCVNLVDNHCTLCGCACDDANRLINKLTLKSEVCPIGKWK